MKASVFLPISVPRWNIPITRSRLLKTACARRPDAIALVDGDIRMSFRELDVLSNACARAMLAEGIGIGDRVRLFLPNSAEFEIGRFRRIEDRRRFHADEPAVQRSRAAYQLNDSGAKILITTAEGAVVVREVQKRTPDARDHHRHG